MHHSLTSLSFLASLAHFVNGQYSATYLPSNVPAKTEQGQTGTNQCGTGSNQNSQCQNVFINSVTDFCLFAPPNPGPDSVIGNTERIEVSWCLQSGTGTRLIPDGAIKGAHFVQTPDFVQVTGIGDLTKLNIPAGDEGGELDPHGADGNGNPIGGLVFSSAFGKVEQIHEWTMFMSDTEFCFRACKPGPKAATWCQHIYDVMGCEWNMPANYNAGFESCQGDSGQPMGVYGTSTFHQGQPVTPPAHPVPFSSRCQALNTIGNGIAISTPPAPPATSASPSSHSSINSGAPSSASQTAPTGTAPSLTTVLPSTATGGASSGASRGSGLPNAALTQPPAGLSTTGSSTPSSTLTTASSPPPSSKALPRTSAEAIRTMVLSVGLLCLAFVFVGFSLL